jgi:hypothetical protein
MKGCVFGGSIRTDGDLDWRRADVVSTIGSLSFGRNQLVIFVPGSTGWPNGRSLSSSVAPCRSAARSPQIAGPPLRQRAHFAAAPFAKHLTAGLSDAVLRLGARELSLANGVAWLLTMSACEHPAVQSAQRGEQS